MAYRLILILMGLMALSAQAAIISGTVTDATDGAPLPGAVVSVEGSTIADISDFDGHFKLTVPDGQKVNICCAYLGYVRQCRELMARGKMTEDFAMAQDSEQLDEVVVTSRNNRDMLNKAQMGVAHIEVADLMKMPAILGEQDVIKSLTLMPGVQAESDGSGGFQVRGGESSQNLVLLDGVTLNNSGHLLGFFSPFNSDILKDVTLYKGTMPAQYGGRCSSVLDISTISGDMQRFHADGSVGILASKICLQGPLAKGKASYLVSARRTYLDLFLKMRDGMEDSRLFFYDMNAKLAFRPSKQDFISASFFRSTDVMSMDDLADIHWGNTFGNLRHNHQFDDGLDLTTTAYYSRYKTSMSLDIGDSSDTGESAESTSLTASDDGRDDQMNLSTDLRATIDDDVMELHLGAALAHHDIITAEWKQAYLHEKEQREANEVAAWINNQWEMGDRWSAAAGLRWSTFNLMGGAPYYTLDSEGEIADTFYPAEDEIVKQYREWEPRAALTFKLTDSKSIKAAYARAAQHVHTIKAGITSMPMDRMTLSTNLFGPEVADQWSVGYAATIASRDGKYSDAVSVEAEVYYKQMDGVLDYREGLHGFNHIEMDRMLLSGIGRSYGLELNAKKNHGKLTGWVSYTLSKTETKIDGLNEGRWYLSNADRRHAIRVVGMYTLSKMWDFSLAWVFNSGQAMSLPVGKYMQNEHVTYYYEGKNNYRTPNYHRLDVSATLHLPKTKAWESEWSFGFYNLYARYNPFMISLKDDETEPSGTRARQTSLFALVPSVTYKFKF